MQKAPKPPTYQPTNYTAPAPYVSSTAAPVAGGEYVAGQANDIMNKAPSWLNLSKYDSNTPGSLGGPFDADLMQKASNWYMQNQVMPGIAMAQSDAQGSGQNYGSYGPAFAGQLMGEGQQQAFQAALAANQQEFNDVIQGNQAYYQGPAALAAQQDKLQSTLQEQTNLQNQQQQNYYDLRSAGMANDFNTNQFVNPNSFNLSNYGNQFEANKYNNQITGGMIGAGLGLGGGLLGLI